MTKENLEQKELEKFVQEHFSVFGRLSFVYHRTPTKIYRDMPSYLQDKLENCPRDPEILEFFLQEIHRTRHVLEAIEAEVRRNPHWQEAAAFASIDLYCQDRVYSALKMAKEKEELDPVMKYISRIAQATKRPEDAADAGG